MSYPPHTDTLQVGPIVVTVMDHDNGAHGVIIRGIVGANSQTVSLQVRADGTIHGATVKEYDNGRH